MSKLEKQLKRLQSKPTDYKYNEARTLLNKLGFYEDNKGKTSGSRVMFLNKNGKYIVLHKPHPTKILKPYQLNNILQELEKGGFYNE
jgi:predicted RNA binding protein YcfA (HicA-like mRNA interferase family)